MKYYCLLSCWLLCYACQSPDSPFPPVQDSSAFPTTSMVATLEEKVHWEHNILYCPTLLYAWQSIKDTLPQPLTVDAKQGALKRLHQSKGHLGALEAGEYEQTLVIEDNRIKATVAFKVNLQLETPLEVNPITLEFDQQVVDCFGGYGGDSAIYQQIRVLFYESEAEFALAITPKDQNQELIFYKTNKQKGKSLGALYQALTLKIAKKEQNRHPKEDAWMEDDLVAIPNLAFNIQHNYSDLVDAPFIARKQLYTITQAQQRIALALDETGALVESEAIMEAVAEAIEEPIQARAPLRMVFEDDFLLVAKKEAVAPPYLLVWVSNPAFMN